MLKNTILHAISDQGNAILSKSLVYVGVGGSSIGVATKVAEVTDNVPDSLLTSVEWGAAAGIVGGICLIIKTGTDVYFNYQKEKRAREMHELKKEAVKHDDHN